MAEVVNWTIGVANWGGEGGEWEERVQRIELRNQIRSTANKIIREHVNT